MKRRTFVTVIAAAASAWPRVGRAQARRPRIGALFASDTEPAWQLFREALRAVGYTVGQTIEVELRAAEGRQDRLPALAAELVALKVDLIVTFQTPAAHAARRATGSIPIVMAAAGDPVATGLVDNLARPGGNITGMAGATPELAAKLLELLREALPRARRIAVLANATDPFTAPFLDHIGRGAGALGMSVQPVMVRAAAEFEAAFDAMRTAQADALVHQPSLPRTRAIELALRHRLPSISPTRPYAEEGGLIAYAAHLPTQYRQAAIYVDKILKGDKPGSCRCNGQASSISSSICAPRRRWASLCPRR